MTKFHVGDRVCYTRQPHRPGQVVSVIVTLGRKPDRLRVKSGDEIYEDEASKFDYESVVKIRSL